MANFATAPGAPLEVMTTQQMEAGFACGTLNVDRLNWLFQRLFGRVTSYTSCAGTPLPLNAVIATCADMTAAIAAAIAALPGEKFLQGLQSYNATTNVMTLLMNDGTTVDVPMAGLVSDAVAEALALVDGSETKVQGTSPIVVTGSGTVAAPYQIAIDLNALATALCANATFQACIGAPCAAPAAPAGPIIDMGAPGTPIGGAAGASAWDGATIGSVVDIRCSGTGLLGPLNDTNARIYVGNVSAVHGGAVPYAGAGITNGGCDTAVSGGSHTGVDLCASGPAGLAATGVTTGVPVQVRLTHVSGDPISTTGVWPAQTPYVLGAWHPYNAAEAIWADVIVDAQTANGCTEKEAVVLVEMDFGGGIVLQANVALIAAASDGTPQP